MGLRLVSVALQGGKSKLSEVSKISGVTLPAGEL